MSTSLVPGAQPKPGDQLAWTMLSSEVAYRGFLQMDSRVYRMPDGRTTRWDILAGGPAVGVLARTAGDGVVLARQYRPGPARVLWELPGGILDPGEDPATAAARELVEETGFRAGRVEILGGTWLSGFSEIYKYAAIAHDCVRVGDPVSGDDELCHPEVLDRVDFLRILRSGELTDADTGFRAAAHLGWL